MVGLAGRRVENAGYLEQEGFWVADQLADQATLLFIFMPILRHEIYSFADTHNAHRIYAQPKRPNHVPRIPNELYNERCGGERVGFRPDYSLLDSLIAITTGYDTDAYLSEATIVWFSQIYQELAIPQPKGADFIVDHRPVIPNYYRVVLARARQHQGDLAAIPRLEIAPKPLRDTRLG